MTSIQQRDAQSVLAGIDELLPALRERAQATEDLRRLPDETIQDLDEVGFFKLLQPEQWGGLQCDPTVFYEAVRRLASACGSTGWVASIIGVHNWHLALFDQQAQDEVWGEDPTVRVSSSYAPMGAGTVVDGGYLVNGAWNWSSGCDHASWAFLGGPVIKDGKPVDFGSFLIPRTEYRIDDVWHVVGLQGHRQQHRRRQGRVRAAAPLPVLPAMNDQHRRRPGRTTPRPSTRCLGAQCIPAPSRRPIVGMAYGAYDAHVEHQGKRVRAAFAGEKAKDDPFAKVRIAEAASDIDAAWRQLIGNIGDEYALLLEPVRRSRSSCGPGPAVTRCARPAARSRRSTGCSRHPAPPRCRMTHPCNGSGATHTRVACTPRTIRSGRT